MQAKTQEYYDWFSDVEPAICEKMGISTNAFRRYHEIDNNPAKGKYEDYTNFKDCWHVWLDSFGQNLHNDQFLTIYVPYDHDDEWNFISDDARELRGEWATKVITAFREVCRDHNLCDDRMVIWFSW